MESFWFMIVVAYILVSSLKISLAINSINGSQFIRDGETLVSNGGEFELGFFSPGNSTKRYLGIWYKRIPIENVVWVANRDNPISDTSGSLTISSTGKLKLSQNGSVVWVTNATSAENPVAELLDSGNLVIREAKAKAEEYLWQSFDYPSDTFLPGMKLGWNLRTGLERRITSWKSLEDPSQGDFSWGLVLYDYPEFYLMKGTQKSHRIGPWNGIRFSGLSSQPNLLYVLEYVTTNDPMYASNKAEMYYSFTLRNSSVTVRVKMINGSFQTQAWNVDKQYWTIYESTPRDICDTYALCGPYGNCRVNDSPVCQCFEEFSPKSPQEWNLYDWSQGCVRDTPLSCQHSYTDRFVKYAGLKVPDTTHTWMDENIDLEECRMKCLNDCSCTAFTNTDIRGGGSGCVIWFRDLLDIRQFQTGGEDLYVRMSAVELALDKSKTKTNIQEHLEDLDLPLFDLLTILVAINNFSLNNKIGQGGFGPVYKGKLPNGQEIAVKRLSSSSGQGITEFITEVKLIAKLQHRNLVKLLGCCIQGEEKLLVYEYMANGSLDSFIFDTIRGKWLDWPQRFHIIFGVARGLLYLHQDSRLRIIHRDLKASNVLLDEKLNAKISDFGMARAFGGDQTEGNTNRVVGTYGYMAPEYAVDGQFSIKSDVFSFGILLLEIICGNKNRALCHQNQTLNLVGYAWTLWKEGNILQLVDPSIKDSYDISEVLRCIHVSLLCVQQFPEDRPTMTLIVQMLGSETELFEPKEPGFFPRRTSDEGKLSSNQSNMTSNDELTITSLNGR
ncbi:hypothetical protein VNO77_37177 [Canavalia gladiata]|uniref:Receptor-like serine/threonine-protein kinase n=1 Tax=Canavalia gladiata TaxID=3824 RepID=A0AAN9KB76_CANGL